MLVYLGCGQQAAGVYNGSVTNLADELFDALATWNAQWPDERKVEWTLSLGVMSVLRQPDQRPLAPPVEPVGLSRADLGAVEDMAAFFQIARRKASLLFRIGRALGNPAPDQQAAVGGRLCRHLRSKQADTCPIRSTSYCASSLTRGLLIFA
jgi:hypothetical protein